MVKLLFISDLDDPDEWRARLERHVPNLQFVVGPEDLPSRDVDIALVWRTPDRELARYPSLKAVLSLGAGVDQLLVNNDLPAATRLARIVDPTLAELVADYVLTACLRVHRRFDDWERRSRAREWRFEPPRLLSEGRVGVIGQGHMGSAISARLAGVGFEVRGWTRQHGQIGKDRADSGRLPDFLWDRDIIVLALPLTDETREIVDATFLAHLPKGAHIVNVGRGGLLNDQAVVDALQFEYLGGATLDAFATEPLPQNHPFWSNDRILITPHVAGIAQPDAAIAQIVANIANGVAGRPLANEVDTVRGY